eukprot:CFRG8533T1
MEQNSLLDESAMPLSSLSASIAASHAMIPEQTTCTQLQNASGAETVGISVYSSDCTQRDEQVIDPVSEKQFTGTKNEVETDESMITDETRCIDESVSREVGENETLEPSKVIDIVGGVRLLCTYSMPNISHVKPICVSPRNNYDINTENAVQSKDIKVNVCTQTHSPTKTSIQQSESITLNNFYKGVKWSPDGSHLLTCTDDNSMRLYKLPTDIDYYDNRYCGQVQEVADMPAGEMVYDYAWYPGMQYWDPVTCVYITCTRDHPIHLRDATTGGGPYNHLDENEAANSVTFSPDGTKIYCGFEKMIRIFDTNRPGRDHIDLKTLAHKRAKGQRGIISTIAFSSVSPSLFAAGSYDRTIALYVSNDSKPVARFNGSKGGVTQVQFSPDGLYLYSGGRRDDTLTCWDVRMAGRIAGIMKRKADTNQKLQFDIDVEGKYLMTGSQDSTIRVFDLNGEWPEHVKSPLEPLRVISSPGPGVVNGVGFHPHYPIIAAVSGQRHFVIRGVSDSESESSSAESEPESMSAFEMDSTANTNVNETLNSNSRYHSARFLNQWDPKCLTECHE